MTCEENLGDPCSYFMHYYHTGRQSILESSNRPGFRPGSAHAAAAESKNDADPANASGKDLKAKIKALPGALEKAANRAQKEESQVRVAMVGADSTQALAPLLQQRLDQTFGELFFKVTPVDLGTSTSLALNEKKLNDLFKNLNGKPDAVIFTPLLYNDDHQVSTSDTETVTGLFEEKIRISYPDVAFYVSLPNYSANADYMNDRIDGLKSYIEDQKIPELDYLSKWAKGDDRRNWSPRMVIR
ncbi:hypothetical protein ABNN70_07675 [Sporolactobacillus sp. Y61]|uniref:SGNH/GDSL hydrolase family protein n=1 Tax=Sporolactobacillus sp. Y61 TaxID=3160863 RepID=A0AAU8IBR5_9BACL